MTWPVSQIIAVGASLCIVLLDWMQPLLFAWRAKYVGAVLGGAIYLVAAVGLARGVRGLAGVLLVMPAIPLATLALFACGVSLPVRPDGFMIGVLSLQLTAALGSFVLLRTPRTRAR